jgi:ketosteroid isomerase-like protein
MADKSAVVRNAYGAFARGDFGALIEMLDDDVEWVSPTTLPQGGQYNGKAGVGAFLQAVGGAWKSLTLAVESVSDGENDLVIGVVDASGTRQDNTPGGYGAVHVFSVRDDRIVRFREYTDLDTSIA